jgi:fructose-1,6-bisphosphatase/inositol monophosphatase family enzyme
MHPALRENAMSELDLDQRVLRYCRQVIMLAMHYVRSRMRGEELLTLKRKAAHPHLQKSEQNLTKVIDQETENVIVRALQSKFTKLKDVRAYTVFSEELGIKIFPKGSKEAEAHLVVIIDPIDGTEYRNSARRLVAGCCI